MKGLGTALITPFLENGDIDYAALDALVEHQISGGTDYLVLLGTTSEVPTLSYAEQDAIIAHVVKKVAGRIPLVMGIGGNSTHTVVARINSVKDVLSLLRGEPVDLDIPQNQSDEEAMAGGNGAIGVSPSVVMRFERDILPPDLGLDQDSLIYVRSLLKAYIHNKGNLANLVDNIIQTRLKKRYAPLIPSNV